MKMWAEETLGELCSLITDGKHGDCRNEDDSGYYFISCKDVREGRIHYENSRQIVHGDFAETHRRTDLGPGDVLLTNSGTIGRLAIAPDDEKTQRTTFQKSVAILKPLPERITSHFLYYSLASDRARLINSAGGAAQKNLLLGELRRFPIRVPPLAEQDRIASTLSAYDDLIENNRRRIQLLEQAVRLLYREWFVQLHFPGHEHVKIKDGVPEGWEKKSLTDLADSVSYGLTASSTQEEIGPKFLRITDIVPTILNWEEVPFCEATDKEIERNRLEIGDVVVARTGATVGYAKLISHLMSKAVYASYLVRFRFRTPTNSLIAGIFMESDSYKEHVRNHAGGAAQPNANAKVLGLAILLIPPQVLQEQFSVSVTPVLNQKDALVRQNTYLAKARNLLLPRLMNGEVVV